MAAFEGNAVHSSAEPMCLTDFEEQAMKKLIPEAREYISRGADDELTIKDNVEAFKRWRLRPRMLQGITDVDISTTVLGQTISMPICVAPSASHKLAHPDGEIATAKGVAKSQTLMTLSCFSNVSLKDIKNACPETLRWQHLYFEKGSDKEEMIRLIRQAEESGAKGFVITADEPTRGYKRSVTGDDFFMYTLLKSLGFSYKVAEGIIDIKKERKKDGSGLTWDIIPWLKSITKLPVIVKGILTAEDAKLAVQHGVDAILVSNHGGRQLDGVLATIDALPEVVSAVNGQVEVYMDGGVRLGTDVLKALALGARAVFIGRPVLWGLAYQGEEGVHQVLEMLSTELKRAMILSGCSSLADIPASLATKQCQCHL